MILIFKSKRKSVELLDFVSICSGSCALSSCIVIRRTWVITNDQWFEFSRND